MILSSPQHIEDRPLGASHFHGLRSKTLVGELFDVMIVGSGAAGTIAADTFVRAGLRTLVLEEGARLNTTATNADVDAYSDRALAGNSDQGWSLQGWPWSTRSLGGGTVFYGGASFRYSDFDFDPRKRIRVEGLPVKWPIDASVLAPFYRELESKLFVDHAGFDRAQTKAPNTLSLPAEHLWKGALRLGLNPRRQLYATPRRGESYPYNPSQHFENCPPYNRRGCEGSGQIVLTHLLLAETQSEKGFENYDTTLHS